MKVLTEKLSVHLGSYLGCGHGKPSRRSLGDNSSPWVGQQIHRPNVSESQAGLERRSRGRQPAYTTGKADGSSEKPPYNCIRSLRRGNWERHVEGSAFAFLRLLGVNERVCWDVPCRTRTATRVGGTVEAWNGGHSALHCYALLQSLRLGIRIRGGQRRANSPWVCAPSRHST